MDPLTDERERERKRERERIEGGTRREHKRERKGGHHRVW